MAIPRSPSSARMCPRSNDRSTSAADLSIVTVTGAAVTSVSTNLDYSVPSTRARSQRSHIRRSEDRLIVRGALVVVSEKSSGARRDHRPLIVFSSERLHRGNIGELGDRHELDLAVCRLSSQQVGAVVAHDSMDSRQDIRPKQRLVLVGTLQCRPAVPDSADHATYLELLPLKIVSLPAVLHFMGPRAKAGADLQDLVSGALDGLPAEIFRAQIFRRE